MGDRCRAQVRPFMKNVKFFHVGAAYIVRMYDIVCY